MSVFFRIRDVTNNRVGLWWPCFSLAEYKWADTRCDKVSRTLPGLWTSGRWNIAFSISHTMILCEWIELWWKKFLDFSIASLAWKASLVRLSISSFMDAAWSSQIFLHSIDSPIWFLSPFLSFCYPPMRVLGAQAVKLGSSMLESEGWIRHEPTIIDQKGQAPVDNCQWS
jgi:hypothetical protein